MMEMVTVQKTKLKGPTLLLMVLVQRMYYPYSGAANDDPLTPNIDERQGIPATSQLQNIRLYHGRKN
jgi:hypothetical protein